MRGDAFQPLPQLCLKPIDGVVSGEALDLGANQQALDIEVGLCHHGPLYRRIGALGQLDTGVEYGPVGEPAKQADLPPRVIDGAGQLAVRYDLDVKDVGQIGS
jgi:hypothetical protein